MKRSGRKSKNNYYLDIAQVCLAQGTCLRRNFGAIIVKDDEIISTGYTGSPRGAINCCDHGSCLREELNVPPGERYELCCSVHAEMNACISACRRDMLGSDLYLCGITKKTGKLFDKAYPCELCRRIIVNAGISRVIIRKTATDYICVPVDIL